MWSRTCSRPVTAGRRPAPPPAPLSAARSATSAPSASGRGSKAAPAGPGADVVSGLPLVASGTHYRPGQLRAQVSAVLTHYRTTGRPSGAGTAGPTPPTATFPQLRACVAHFAGSERPRLVDLALYGTRPAAVIVVPASDPTQVNVWVVGRGCSAQGGDVIARFSMPAPG